MPLALDEFDPAFRARLAAATRRIEREGVPPPLAGATVATGAADGIRLMLAVVDRDGTPTIAAARHAGAMQPALRGALDRFCALIEGLPLLEAAEHGAHHLVADLREPGAGSPVAGILTPRNAGAPFALAERLVRAAADSWRDAGGALADDNFWNPALAEGWRTMAREAQADSLKPLLAPAAAEAGIAAEELWIADIERGFRVVVAFGPNVAPAAKPKLLMRLEERMREATGQRLEVYMEEMKDQNRIRRL